MTPEPLLDLHPEEYGLPESLCHDLRTLDLALGSVIREQEGDEVIESCRAIYHAAKEGGAGPFIHTARRPDLAHKTARAYTILFQLINTCEQKEIIRVNRARSARRETILEAVTTLHETGVSREQAAEILARSSIVPTLTAHPTEARRREVLDKLEEISELLAELGQPRDPYSLTRPLTDEGMAFTDLQRVITALWQTDEIAPSQPKVEDEVTSVLGYFHRSIFTIAAWIMRDLERATHQVYGEELPTPKILRYRSWVGGDRDGNPNVTALVTWRTAVLHRQTALYNFARLVRKLKVKLTQGAGQLKHPEEASAWALKAAEPVLTPAQIAPIQSMPFVLRLAAIEARLLLSQEHATRLVDDAYAEPKPGACVTTSDFLADLADLKERMILEGAGSSALSGPFARLMREAAVFGLNLGALDIRQHSDLHAPAVGELLEAAGVIGSAQEYLEMDEDAKFEVLVKELSSPRPLASHDFRGSEACEKVRAVFNAVRRIHRSMGHDLVQAYIISMTHGASDILEVLLLAKDARLLRYIGGQWESDLDIVPLLETVDDLNRGPGLLRRIWSVPACREGLASREGTQEIMLGYSDSSKDGGFLAANWALQKAQATLAQAAMDSGIKVRFFHGRGGTVGRGGGRANQAIMSQPHDGFEGQIRFTEQGEVISFRYSLPPIGHRHLEQIVAATLLAASGVKTTDPKPDWTSLMEDIAGQSEAFYRRAIHEDPDFWPFYTQATPIESIGGLTIASRPVMRPDKKQHDLDGLRAIPWNFAWVQTRGAVPGWFGLGQALEWAIQQGRLAVLQEMAQGWPFFQTLVGNVELELIRADMETFTHYAAIAQPPELSYKYKRLITEEHERAKRCLEQVTGRPLLEGAVVVRKTIRFRNPILLPLNFLQAELMREKRRGHFSDAQQTALLQTIAGIAAGMQSTG